LQEVLFADNMALARSRLWNRPDKVTRRLHLRPEPAAHRRGLAFIDATDSDWNAENLERDACTVTGELVVQHARTGSILLTEILVLRPSRTRCRCRRDRRRNRLGGCFTRISSSPEA
jgi:hypothetical protein